ncbi:MAG: helicase [Rhodospirillum sp.]|nr:helicase [Rhodospirillum sp.]
MYDEETAALIRSTPPLSGLDRDRLPELLSEAFAKIAAARMRLRAGTSVDEDVVALIGEMQRLALTNEAFVASAPTREDRAAAAFVAGSAHQLCFNARKIRRDEEAGSYLEARSISPDLSAMLLFLIAEATADSSELAAHVSMGDMPVLERALIDAIRSLARGELSAITSAAMPNREVVAGTGADAATTALYYRLLIGVRFLASEILRADNATPGHAIEIFRAVQSLSLLPDERSEKAWFRANLGAFAGPYHLASLLIAVAGDLAESAVTAIPPPGGVPKDKWLKSMKRVARGRPYLWRNHRQAIEAGYLEPKMSAAVSFPTGAGKSTLAELKISATLLREKKVIFLAPTNALVGQTTRALRGSFKGAKVGQERINELGFFGDEEELPQIFVMTPEACLAQMSIEPLVFDGVGLMVFDECHLLHAEDDNLRRPLDAMLCVLNFAALAPEVEFLLLSAMMKNTEEIAGWVHEMTGRECLALSLPWKPTRQLRGCVVYPQDEVVALQKHLRKAQAAKKTKAPSKKDKADLISSPLAFFGLKQTWATRQTVDYSLVSLLSEDVQLSASAQYWKLTPNAGVVSTKIATAAADSGIKTLIFFQTIPNAVATKKRFVSELGARSVELTKEEQGWFDIAVLELGSAEHAYIDVDDGKLVSPAVVHHGLLLPEERQLCESLFQRADGAAIMAATPTVAQGMNFPSELVIIAEDSRFEAEANKREILEAQELLNAAGRAGRAGQNANGIVLVIPGRVVGIDIDDAKIGNYWTTLQKVFGQSDQCLVIDDPLTAILDRIHSKVAGSEELQRYAIARLSTGGLEASLKKTLAGFRARQKGKDVWFASRVASAVAFHEKQAPETDSELAVHQVSSTLGIALPVVKRLSADLTQNVIELNKTIKDWREWLFDWIEANADLFDQILRPSTIDELFDDSFATTTNSKERAKVALPTLRNLTRLWMRAAPLRDLQLALGTKPDKLKACLDARRFALRVVPELAFLFGVPAFLIQRKAERDDADSTELPAALAKLGVCVRQGYRSVDHVALAYYLGSARLSRRQVQEQFESIKPYLSPTERSATWDQRVSRVEEAVIKAINARGDQH